MANYHKTEVVTQIGWAELINAVRGAADKVPDGECSIFMADQLAEASRVVRRKATEANAKFLARGSAAIVAASSGG